MKQILDYERAKYASKIISKMKSDYLYDKEGNLLKKTDLSFHEMFGKIRAYYVDDCINYFIDKGLISVDELEFGVKLIRGKFIGSIYVHEESNYMEKIAIFDASINIILNVYYE